MKVKVLLGKRVDARLQLLMLEDLDALIAMQQQPHLFARRERPRITEHRLERDNALL